MFAEGDLEEKWYFKRMNWISKFPTRMTWIFETPKAAK
jgi:hypothetical protein